MAGDCTCQKDCQNCGSQGTGCACPKNKCNCPQCPNKAHTEHCACIKGGADSCGCTNSGKPCTCG